MPSSTLVNDLTHPAMYRALFSGGARLWPAHVTHWAVDSMDPIILRRLMDDNDVAQSMQAGNNLSQTVTEFWEFYGRLQDGPANNPTFAEFPRAKLHLILCYVMHFLAAPIWNDELCLRYGANPMGLEPVVRKYWEMIDNIETPLELVDMLEQALLDGFDIITPVTKEDFDEVVT